MDLGLRGRRTLTTGATRGVGLALAAPDPSAIGFRNAEADWRATFKIDLPRSIRPLDESLPHRI